MDGGDSSCWSSVVGSPWGLQEWKRASEASRSGLGLVNLWKGSEGEAGRGSPSILVRATQQQMGMRDSPLKEGLRFQRKVVTLDVEEDNEDDGLQSSGKGELGSSCSEESLDSIPSDSPVKRPCSVGLAYIVTERLPRRDENTAMIRQIMHELIPDLLFNASVAVYCPANILSEKFDMNPDYVRRNWVVNVEDEIGPDNSGMTKQKGLSSKDMLLRNGMSRPIEAQELAMALRRLQLIQGPKCGLASCSCHKNVKLCCDGQLCIRGRGGLYCSVQSLAFISSKSFDPVYFEFSFLEDPSKRGGVCFGLSSRNFNLDKLVGNEPNSIGFHSSGDLIFDGKWCKYGEAFGEMDSIGCLIEMPDLHSEDGSFNSTEDPENSVMSDASAEIAVEVTFFKNGNSMGKARPRLTLVDGVLFPTISMYREGAKVEFRCCASDIEHGWLNLPASTRPICGVRFGQ